MRDSGVDSYALLTRLPLSAGPNLQQLTFNKLTTLQINDLNEAFLQDLLIVLQYFQLGSALPQMQVFPSSYYPEQYPNMLEIH